MQHYSLKYFDKNFDELFIKRINTLNLKLDCTGFWSGYIKELSQNSLAQELSYLFVVRKPSDWIKSVINYFTSEYDHLYFDFVGEYYWKKRVGVKITGFFELNKNEQNKVITHLIEFYFKATRDSTLLKKVHYVRLSEIDKILPVIDALINEKANIKKAFKREAKQNTKYFNYKNEALDNEYESLLSELGILELLIK